jgi:hypothetical protein
LDELADSMAMVSTAEPGRAAVVVVVVVLGLCGLTATDTSRSTTASPASDKPASLSDEGSVTAPAPPAAEIAPPKRGQLGLSIAPAFCTLALSVALTCDS